MTGHVTALELRTLNRKQGTYSKEDCGRDDPSMSPGSRSRRER